MAQGWLQIAIFVAVLVALVKPVGIYMARVFTNQRVFLTPVVGPIERLAYRALRVRPERGPGLEGLRPQPDRLLAALLGRALPDPAHPGHPAVQPRRLPLRPLGPQLQHRLLLRHQHQLAVLRRRNDAHLLRPDGRADGAELRLRRRSGSPSLVALIRGIVARTGAALGNFWQDLVRILLYVLLPISIVGALFLVSQGVIQNLGDCDRRSTPSTAAPRSSARARSPRRRRSSSSAPTAAASSTSTPPSRSRTRAASPTSSRCC